MLNGQCREEDDEAPLIADGCGGGCWICGWCGAAAAAADDRGALPPPLEEDGRSWKMPKDCKGIK